MDKKESMIKKYPYLAYSTNIMEYFAMIGYQERYINKIFANKRYKCKLGNPTILFSVTSRSDFGIIDNEMILTQVYPDIPTLIPVNDINNEEDITSNVIYYFCYDSEDGKEKLFYICYAYKFYEKFKYYQKKVSI